MTGQLTFAFVAGTVATVNPCGFALLPAYLARQLGSGSDHARRPDSLLRALTVGALTTVGFLLVFGTIGTGIALGARSLTRAIPWAALVIGVALVLAGTAVLFGRHIGIRLPFPARRPAGHGNGSVLLFGLGYGVASLSCTFPVFLVVVGTAITGETLTGSLMFVAYALGMGTILTSLAIAAALSRSGLATSIRRLLPHVNRVSGGLLVLAGAYVVYYWAFFLSGGSSASGRWYAPVGAVNRLSSTLQSWFSQGSGQTVSVALAVLLAAFIAWALWRQAWKRTAAATTREGRASERVAPGAASGFLRSEHDG